jgi:hypothetical protein
VQRAVSGQSGWSVDTDAIALGFFSFAKFLMYRDLDPTTWPAADAILGHEVLQALLAEQGFQSSSSIYREDCLLDDQLQNRDIVQVVDSDSSQTIAILDCWRVCWWKRWRRASNRPSIATPTARSCGPTWGGNWYPNKREPQ